MQDVPHPGRPGPPASPPRPRHRSTPALCNRPATRVSARCLPHPTARLTRPGSPRLWVVAPTGFATPAAGRTPADAAPQPGCARRDCRSRCRNDRRGPRRCRAGTGRRPDWPRWWGRGRPPRPAPRCRAAPPRRRGWRARGTSARPRARDPAAMRPGAHRAGPRTPPPRAAARRRGCGWERGPDSRSPRSPHCPRAHRRSRCRRADRSAARTSPAKRP